MIIKHTWTQVNSKSFIYHTFIQHAVLPSVFLLPVFMLSNLVIFLSFDFHLKISLVFHWCCIQIVIFLLFPLNCYFMFHMCCFVYTDCDFLLLLPLIGILSLSVCFLKSLCHNKDVQSLTLPLVCMYK